MVKGKYSEIGYPFERSIIFVWCAGGMGQSRKCSWWVILVEQLTYLNGFSNFVGQVDV